MNHCSVIATLALVFVVTGLACAAPKPLDPVFVPVQEVAGLPRVLLIGDSISMGYTLPVRQLLEGKANVQRIPENGGPTSRGLQQLTKWLGTGKWDVIHFNFGLHDLKFLTDGTQQTPIADYEKNLRELVKRLKATGAKVIWCSTTPVPEGKLNPVRKNSDVIAYNAVALKVMQENGIAVDDLYSFAWPKLAQIQLPQNVHFNPQGYKVLAGCVVASIQAALAPPAQGE